jgi:TPR repeat protein
MIVQYHTFQASVMSSQCPTGTKEAEELYQLGRQYRYGHGVPGDKKKAERLFEQSLAKGNAKAALAIGDMYRDDYATVYPGHPTGTLPAKQRHKYMRNMYAHAANMGCPEAYLIIGKCFENGWGMPSDRGKALACLLKAAEMGSPKGMEFWGKFLVESGQLQTGITWVEKSLSLGNGDAGVTLASIYSYLKDIEKIMKSLREGARLGSRECLMQLYLTYLQGYDGQNKDKEYAQCFKKLLDSIDVYYPPQPIPDFDKICPPKLPYLPHDRLKPR